MPEAVRADRVAAVGDDALDLCENLVKGVLAAFSGDLFPKRGEGLVVAPRSQQGQDSQRIQPVERLCAQLRLFRISTSRALLRRDFEVQVVGDFSFTSEARAADHADHILFDDVPAPP